MLAVESKAQAEDTGHPHTKFGKDDDRGISPIQAFQPLGRLYDFPSSRICPTMRLDWIIIIRSDVPRTCIGMLMHDRSANKICCVLENIADAQF